MVAKRKTKKAYKVKAKVKRTKTVKAKRIVKTKRTVKVKVNRSMPFRFSLKGFLKAFNLKF